MVQRWTDVMFLHWRYQPEVVQRLLPAGVTVEVHDGSAWVGLVPFQMEGQGLPGLAPLPLVGSFPEVNVRTYVAAGSRRGVHFFSLDIDKLLAAAVARIAYHLPYCYGRVEHRRAGNLVTTRVQRRWPRPYRGPTADLAVRTGVPVDPDDRLTHFLTDRWGLISATKRGGLRYAPVDHPACPIHHVRVAHVEEHLLTAVGLPAPVGTPHALWSPGVDVRVGRPRRIRGTSWQDSPAAARAPSVRPARRLA